MCTVGSTTTSRDFNLATHVHWGVREHLDTQDLTTYVH